MKTFGCDCEEYLNTMEHKDYCIIDPPWRYDDRSPKAAFATNYGLWIDNELQLCTIFDTVKADFLFIWTTNSMLPCLFNAHDRSSRRFKYKTLLTWVKTTNTGKLFFGMGNTFRNCTEHLAVFSLPKIKPLRLQIRNIIQHLVAKDTGKPKGFERKLVNEMENRGYMKGAYLFSGTDISIFEDNDMDMVDTKFNINTN